MAVIVNGDGILTGISSLATALTDLTSGRGTITGVTTVGTLQLGTGVSISSPRSQQAAIFTNNTEFLTVDDAGRVGVGTITPNSDAHPENEKKINVGFITARSVAGDIDANTMVVAGVSTCVGTLNSPGGIILTGNMSVASDTAKVFFGASNDLSIYHTGSHSFIEQSGTGHLILGGVPNGNNVDIMKAGYSEYMARFKPDSSVDLYYDANVRLKTSPSGVDITDTLNVAGISTFLGNVNITGTSCLLNFTDTNNNSDFRIQVESGSFLIEDATNSYADRLVILSNGHTIIGGASGSAGNRSQYAMLAVRGNNSSATGHGVLNLMSGANRSNTEEVSQITFADPEGDYAWIQSFADNVTGSSDKPGRLTFSTTPDGGVVPTEKLRITNDGKIGINKIAPEAALHIAGPASGLMSRMRITCTDSGNHTFAVGADGSGSFQSTINNDRHIIYTNGTMRGSWTEHGLCFGTDDAAVNGLDDYEEGTFNAGWFDDGGNFGNYSVQYGQYTKIGNVVYFCLGLRFSSFTRTPNSSQFCRVGNLPFVSREVGDDQECVFNLYARLWGSGTPPETARIRQSSGSGSNHIEFFMDESQTGNDHTLQGSDFDTSASCRIIVNGFYYTS